MKRPSRRLAGSGAGAAILVGSLLLAGCSERSPIQSTVPYTPTDGVTASLSGLDVRDLLVVSAGLGQPGVLSGALVNTGASDVSVTFAAQGDAVPSDPVAVPQGQLVRLGTGDGDVHVQFTTITAAPGALLPVQVSTPATGPSRLDVPVLPPTLEYATITPTPEPTRTPSDTPSATAIG